MTTARDIADRFGGAAQMARALGFTSEAEHVRGSAMVRMWVKRHYIPAEHFERIVAAAREVGVDVTADDLARVATARLDDKAA